MLLQRREHPVRGQRPPHRRGSRHRRHSQGSGPDRSSRRSAQVRRACRLRRAPHRALLGQGAGLVLGVAGHQGGMQHLHPARRPPMIQPMKSVASSALPTSMTCRRADQRWLNRGSTPTISRTGRFERSPPGGPANRTPRSGELMLQRGVIGLRHRNLRSVQDATVDRQPPATQGLHLVRHCDMGVQVRIAGAGVAVGERAGDQPGDVHLTYPARTLPGIQRVILQKSERRGDRGMMGLFDLRGDRQVSDRPQRRHRLHRGERQVIPPDRRRRRPPEEMPSASTCLRREA